MYRLEVYMAMVMGHAIRCPELQFIVAYSNLVEDDVTENSNEEEWLSGLNLVTDQTSIKVVREARA